MKNIDFLKTTVKLSLGIFATVDSDKRVFTLLKKEEISKACKISLKDASLALDELEKDGSITFNGVAYELNFITFEEVLGV